MASRGTGASTVSSMLKTIKSFQKTSASGVKARSTIVKNAVKSAIKTNKPTKFSKITGATGLKLPKLLVDSQYKASLGNFVAKQAGKATKSFMK